MWPYGTRHLWSITCGGAARHLGIAPHSGVVYSPRGKLGLRHHAHIIHSVDGCFGDRGMKCSQHSWQLITFINYLPTSKLFCRGVVRRDVQPWPLSTQGCKHQPCQTEEESTTHLYHRPSFMHLSVIWTGKNEYGRVEIYG